MDGFGLNAQRVTPFFANTLFVSADDDTRVTLYKGKSDYVNANYVSVS